VLWLLLPLAILITVALLWRWVSRRSGSTGPAVLTGGDSGFESPRDLAQAILARDPDAWLWFQNRYLARMLKQVRDLNQPQDLTPAQLLALGIRSLRRCTDQLQSLLVMGSPVLGSFRVFDLFVMSLALRIDTLERSVERAASRQKPTVPIVAGFQIELAYIPSSLRLSGDLVAFEDTQQQRLVILLADAVHHGLVPAMETSGLLQAFRNSSSSRSPRRILRTLHDQAVRFFEFGRFPTALVAVLDLQARSLTVANAGTPYCGWWVPQSVPVQPLELSGHLVGLPVARPSYDQIVFHMRPGDQIVLATDGLGSLPAKEPVSPGQMLTSQLAQFISENRGSELHDRLHELANTLRDADLDPDDVTFLTITAE